MPSEVRNAFVPLPQGKGRGAAAAVWRLIAGPHFLSLADQAVVSGASFLTTVLVARGSDSRELGIYAIGVSLVVLLLAVQDSLILLPYSIQRPDASKASARHAGTSLMLSTVLSLAMALALGVVALALTVGGAGGAVATTAWAVAAVAPFALMREFCRRYAFAHLRVIQALKLDVGVIAVQLVALAWLGWTGRMSAVNALAALGVAYAAVAAVWLYLARHEFVLALGEMRAMVRQNWGLARWLLVSRLTVQMQGYTTHWLLGVIAGAAVTGVYAACMSVVALVNPLVFGFGNVMTPRCVLSWKQGGSLALRRQVYRDALLIAALMAVFCLGIAVTGDAIMAFLYRGPEFEGHHHTLVVLALTISLGAVGTPFASGLSSIERPRAVSFVSIAGIVSTVLLVSCLLPVWGLLGAAYGCLAGGVVGAGGRWLAFISVVPRVGNPAAATAALRDFLPSEDDGVWTARQLGEGDYATVHAVRAKSGHALWQTEPSLVVKLFKEPTDATLAVADGQIAALSGLHALLDGRSFDGWTIRVPRPLHLSRYPLAVIMTTAPGQDIDACVAAGKASPQELTEAANAFAAAMDEAWSRGQFHGDFKLRNVMFNFDRRTIAIIDAGAVDGFRPVRADGTPHDLATVDLANLVCELATDVNDLLGSPAARARRHMFVEAVLAALVKNGRSLDNVWSCARAQLESDLDPSWSPRGIWHRFVRQIATNRLRALRDQLIDGAARRAGPG